MILSRRWLVELAVLAAAILVLAALGPFGSFGSPAGNRLLLWSLYLLGGYVFFRPVIAAGSALARQTGIPRLLAILVACLFGAFPTSLLVAWLSVGARWRELGAGDLAAIYPPVLIVGTTVTLVQLLARQAREGGEPGAVARPDPAPAPSEAPVVPSADPAPLEALDAPPAAAPAFLDLLPPHLGSDIICLENEDHYVRVHTRLGNALILIRMRDAVAQLEGRGERVHRSWWVARDAVAALVREDRNLKLRLTDGREVPIARANVAALREKGWLADLPSGA